MTQNLPSGKKARSHVDSVVPSDGAHWVCRGFFLLNALVLCFGQGSECVASERGTSDGLRPPGHNQVKASPHWIAGLPYAMQMNEYSCGVGVTQAVLAYFDPKRFWDYQTTLAKALGTTPKAGTHPLRIVSLLNQQGLKSTLREFMTLADLERCVDRKIPVIIDYQAWGAHGVQYSRAWEDGHYSVVRGYDARNLYLMDPSLMPGTTGYISKQELLVRWHDYEIEKGRRRRFVRTGIVVEGRRFRRPALVHTD